jgi:hypothetical protein
VARVSSSQYAWQPERDGGHVGEESEHDDFGRRGDALCEWRARHGQRNDCLSRLSDAVELIGTNDRTQVSGREPLAVHRLRDALLRSAETVAEKTSRLVLAWPSQRGSPKDQRERGEGLLTVPTR